MSLSAWRSGDCEGKGPVDLFELALEKQHNVSSALLFTLIYSIDRSLRSTSHPHIQSCMPIDVWLWAIGRSLSTPSSVLYCIGREPEELWGKPHGASLAMQPGFAHDGRKEDVLCRPTYPQHVHLGLDLIKQSRRGRSCGKEWLTSIKGCMRLSLFTSIVVMS